MAGSISVGGKVIATHTGPKGAGTVSLGTNIRLSEGGGIQDSSGNDVLTESSGSVSFGNVIGGVPAGAIMSFAMETPPTGWIVCNGAEYAIADYGDLYAAIGIIWGTLTNGSGGVGSTHFRVPDLRGEFLRGFDNGQGNDPDAASRTGGDAVGSSQTDAFQGHRHGVSHDARKWAGIYRGGGPSYAADQIASITITEPTTSATYGTVRVASETRPKNKYVQYCIKY